MKLSEYKTVEPITKGWSKDKKYCITKEEGIKYLLRISAADLIEKIGSSQLRSIKWSGRLVPSIGVVFR
jgi:hypothetical protein